MAIEFLRAKVVSRQNSSRSMPAHLAYRACTKIYDQRQKKTFNYTNKESVLDSFIVNGGGNDLEQLANKIEASEKRKNSQLVRELILALPHELDLSANKKLCEEFTKRITDEFEVAAHVAIHKPDELRDYETHRSEDSLKNVHAHITVTFRKMGKDGEFFGNKIRAMNDRKWLESLKEDTFELMNRYLMEGGFDPMEKQDSDKVAQKHLGPELTRMERRGEDCVKGDINRATERINLLNAQKADVEEGALDLKKGLTKKGLIKAPGMHISYGEDHPVVVLSRRSRDDLELDVGNGNLRAHKWLAPGILESVNYAGEAIHIAELLLCQKGFTYGKLKRVERALDERFGVDPAIFGVYPIRQSGLGNQAYQRYKGVRSGNELQVRKARLNTYVPKGVTDFGDKEALWHAMQAVRNLEENTNH